MKVLAVDPSVRSAGWALFFNGTLTRAGLKQVSAKVDTESAIEEMARSFAVDFREVDVLVMEKPQVYQRIHQKGNQADIITLALVAGAICVSIQHAKMQWYLPRVWKGQTTKDVTEARVKLALPPAELALVNYCGAPPSLLHNVYDAVGLGLHYLKFGPR